MSFKDVIASDVHDTFMNADEFSDMHDLNGKMMPVQVDSNEQIEREKRFNQHMDGIYKNQKLIYVSSHRLWINAETGIPDPIRQEAIQGG